MRDERDISSRSPAPVVTGGDGSHDDTINIEIPTHASISSISWNAVIEGRFRLVERIDSNNGRRSVHVEENAPEARARFALTSRERKVIKLALLGHSNKLISYELGLPQSTVSTVLRSITTKLGGRSRLDLVRLLASVTAPQ